MSAHGTLPPVLASLEASANELEATGDDSLTAAGRALRAVLAMEIARLQELDPLAAQLAPIVDELWADCGRRPSIADVARRTGWSASGLKKALQRKPGLWLRLTRRAESGSLFGSQIGSTVVMGGIKIDKSGPGAGA